jgi:hypothetical protein
VPFFHFSPFSFCVLLYTDHLFSSPQPQQRRLVNDLERRINPLFDALNCETLSPGMMQQLLILVDGECLMPIPLEFEQRGSKIHIIEPTQAHITQYSL